MEIEQLAILNKIVLNVIGVQKIITMFSMYVVCKSDAIIDKRFVIPMVTKTETIQSTLVADVITLENLSVRDLLSALLVNRDGTKSPFQCIGKLHSVIQREGVGCTKNLRIVSRKQYTSRNERKFCAGAVQETSVLYDYPLFLKELNYTNLPELGELAVETLQMLTNRGIRLMTFVMDNTGTNSETFYGIWTALRFAPIFQTLYYLEKLLSVQQCPLNLRLVFPNGPGRMLINIFQSQKFKSFKHLELVRCDFNGFEWRWLEMCPNLTEFAITIPPQTQVSDETYRLKLSKKS
ncbi:12355_t:CDS:2 [Ambispora gerdemannii]|uniref:12355_t:CDS:1 n=1 Tax=Ambispora gerdemannii TaxID=144530 RepID=A0A9N9CL19_9GLOM|nr:12355_t:CDS:2 [Ambispora gerdemannii]